MCFISLLKTPDDNRLGVIATIYSSTLMQDSYRTFLQLEEMTTVLRSVIYFTWIRLPLNQCGFEFIDSTPWVWSAQLAGL